jgi:hypothetical protein
MMLLSDCTLEKHEVYIKRSSVCVIYMFIDVSVACVVTVCLYCKLSRHTNFVLLNP